MPGIFEIYVKTHFSAAHSLKGYQGDCARIHGHNWLIEIYVKCSELDKIGIGIDFRNIKKVIKNVIADVDHYNLNEIPAFKKINPTSENIARYLYLQLKDRINSDTVKISKVKVSETPSAGAFYWEE